MWITLSSVNYVWNAFRFDPKPRYVFRARRSKQFTGVDRALILI